MRSLARSKRSAGFVALGLWPVWLLLLLAACSDEPTSPPGTVRQTVVNSSNSLNGSATSNPPTVPPPTPTYTPLPVTVTPPATPTPPVLIGGKASGAFLSDAFTLHPYKRNNATGEHFIGLLYAAALTRRDSATLLPVSSAAESWTINDTTVTFTLKESLKWSDGRPLTSADYLWTYQQARKPENGWPLLKAAFYNPADPGSNGIQSYEAPDPRTIRVKLYTASSDLLGRADVIEPLPRHIWEKLDWNDGAKNPQINAPTVVSGPWKLKQWERGNFTSFERNSAPATYQQARLETLTFYALTDSQVALQKLKSGELDFYAPAAAEYAAFAALPNLQAYTWGPGRATWYFAGFNFRKPELQNKALRQALAWAVDRRSVLEKQAFGLARFLNSSVSPWHPSFNAFTARYELNLDKAREMLKQGGYSLKDGKLLNKDGKPLTPLKLVYNAPSPLYDGIAGTLKANFAALGLQMELRNFDFDTYQKFLASPSADFDLFLSGWATDYAPENFGEVWRAGLELNSGMYENSRLLDMYAKAQAEPDATRRKEWLDQVQAIEAEELPYLFLYAEQGWLVVNKRLAGFAPNLLDPARNLYTDWFASS